MKVKVEVGKLVRIYSATTRLNQTCLAFATIEYFAKKRGESTK